MDLDIFETINAKATAVITAVAGFVVLSFKVRRSATQDNKESAADSAVTNTIELLRAEVIRLSDQNTKLADIVNTLQIQVIALRRENSELQLIKKMNEQNASRTS